MSTDEKKVPKTEEEKKEKKPTESNENGEEIGSSLHNFESFP